MAILGQDSMNFFKIHKNLARFLICLSLCGSPLLAEDGSSAVHSEEVANILQEENSQAFVLENEGVPCSEVQQAFVSESLDSSDVFGRTLEDVFLKSSLDSLSLSADGLASSQELMSEKFLPRCGGVSNSREFSFYLGQIPSAKHFPYRGLLDLQVAGILDHSRVSFCLNGQSSFLYAKSSVAVMSDRKGNEFAGIPLCLQISAIAKLAERPEDYPMEYLLSAPRVSDFSLSKNERGNFSDNEIIPSRRKLNLGLSKNQILGRDIVKGHSFALRKNNLRQDRLGLGYLPVFSDNIAFGKSFCCAQCLFYSNGKLWGDQQQPSVNC